MRCQNANDQSEIQLIELVSRVLVKNAGAYRGSAGQLLGGEHLPVLSRGRGFRQVLWTGKPKIYRTDDKNFQYQRTIV